ncbi:DUF3618 domain-containing protein [Paenarthrobacter sp. Z7-10]|uniref:DUF3618 domain-containing protein n=1 Tax=Paenarthrobacter sp. Z7-10 TaxID=2787635 RepID=UPI0022A8E8CB|nr:DUF3618 domain-containing protein [Paenarthrobacter sp. Z7-10]MCZ2405015.1 DUF3618 domain-containing protein [Paenarthrobacter sp. Z7-10]
MSENPEVLRANIEQTRAALSANVDALADKVSPSHIVDRQTEKVKENVRGAVTGLKDRVMGAADHVGNTAHSAVSGVGDTLSDTGEAIGDAPHQVASKAQGNPMAAGLIAFGAGMLIASLIPASQKEREAAEAIKDAAAPLTSHLAEAAKDVAQELQEPAQEAVESVKNTVSDAAGHVKDESQSAAGDVTDRAAQAKDNVQNA